MNIKKLIKKIKCYLGYHKMKNLGWMGDTIFFKCKNCNKRHFETKV